MGRGRRSGVIFMALLLVLFGAGTTLRVVRAADPTRYTSQDEAAYRTLAKTMAEGEAYSHAPDVDPFHWPPAAPAAFAGAMGLAGDTSTAPAYWVQALISVLIMAAAFLLARRLGGDWAGVAAMAAVALYPPLVRGPGDLLSEPLGALFLTAAILALAVATRGSEAKAYALSGFLLGLFVLTRADHLLLPGAVAIGLGLWLWRREGRRKAIRLAGTLAAAAALVIAPWAAYASITEGELILVTRGGGSALFVGTYLPGDGTTSGLKRELGNELRHADPEFVGQPDHRLPAGRILDVVAERRPDRSRNDALSAEGRENLRRYALGEPLDFGPMMARKAWRMWSRPFSGGRYVAGAPERGAHLALLALAVVGLALGMRSRPRDPVLWTIAGAVLLATLLHTIVVSQPRYNLPLMPILFAGGAAGWALVLQSRPEVKSASASEK